MTGEEKKRLIEEAERRYPLGTKFKCLNGNTHRNPIDRHSKFNFMDFDGKPAIYWHNGWVYIDGKWAETTNTLLRYTASAPNSLNIVRLRATEDVTKGNVKFCGNIYNGQIRKGDKTWALKKDWERSKISSTLFIEDNRFAADFKRSTFELDVESTPQTLDKEALLKEADERYPIGTTYKSVRSGKEYTAKEKAYWFRPTSIAMGSQTGLVWEDGEWAEVIGTYEPRSVPSHFDDGREIRWLRATKDIIQSDLSCVGIYKNQIKKGDKTWTRQAKWTGIGNHVLIIENNRYGANFNSQDFELISDSEPTKHPKLLEAERRYPRGTEYYGAYSPTHTSISTGKFRITDSGKSLLGVNDRGHDLLIIWTEENGWGKVKLSSPHTTGQAVDIPSKGYVTGHDPYSGYIGTRSHATIYTPFDLNLIKEFGRRKPKKVKKQIKLLSTQEESWKLK